MYFSIGKDFNYQMTIREVTRFSDRVFESMARLVPQLNPDSELPTRVKLKSILKAKGTHLFIAENDNKEITGMLTLVIYDIPSGLRAWIEDVVVDDRFRAMGIGRGLVEHAIVFAGLAGAKSVDLTSRPFRKAANKLYKKMGFALRETNVYRYKIG
jgi:ribosomal protein S18 acetylase RimI-like enzyme